MRGGNALNAQGRFQMHRLQQWLGAIGAVEWAERQTNRLDVYVNANGFSVVATCLGHLLPSSMCATLGHVRANHNSAGGRQHRELLQAFPRYTDLPLSA